MIMDTIIRAPKAYLGQYYARVLCPLWIYQFSLPEGILCGLLSLVSRLVARTLSRTLLSRRLLPLS